MATVKGYDIMPSKKLDFKTGQYVVYPTQGVGKLLRIEEQTIADQKIKMMVIDFERNHMTLRVPLERAEISGLRPLTSVKKMDEAIASAKGRAGAKRMIWARRAAQYEENINSGDPMKLAEVVRDLQRRSAADTMTFSARQLYLRALERMAQEFAVLHKIDLDAASDKIEDILGIPKEIDLNAVESDDEEEIEEDS
jgi:CarD family transcriptional regulator